MLSLHHLFTALLFFIFYVIASNRAFEVILRTTIRHQKDLVISATHLQGRRLYVATQRPKLSLLINNQLVILNNSPTVQHGSIIEFLTTSADEHWLALIVKEPTEGRRLLVYSRTAPWTPFSYKLHQKCLLQEYKLESLKGVTLSVGKVIELSLNNQGLVALLLEPLQRKQSIEAKQLEHRQLKKQEEQKCVNSELVGVAPSAHVQIPLSIKEVFGGHWRQVFLLDKNGEVERLDGPGMLMSLSEHALLVSNQRIRSGNGVSHIKAAFSSVTLYTLLDSKRDESNRSVLSARIPGLLGAPIVMPRPCARIEKISLSQSGLYYAILGRNFRDKPTYVIGRTDNLVTSTLFKHVARGEPLTMDFYDHAQLFISTQDTDQGGEMMMVMNLGDGRVWYLEITGIHQEPGAGEHLKAIKQNVHRIVKPINFSDFQIHQLQLKPTSQISEPVKRNNQEEYKVVKQDQSDLAKHKKKEIGEEKRAPTTIPTALKMQDSKTKREVKPPSSALGSNVKDWLSKPLTSAGKDGKRVVSRIIVPPPPPPFSPPPYSKDEHLGSVPSYPYSTPPPPSLGPVVPRIHMIKNQKLLQGSVVSINRTVPIAPKVTVLDKKIEHAQIDSNNKHLTRKARAELDAQRAGMVALHYDPESDSSTS